MADISVQQRVEQPTSMLSSDAISRYVLTALTIAAIGIVGWLGWQFGTVPPDSELLTDSTVGELAAWMADQSEEEAPESILGQYARNWALSLGSDSLDVGILLAAMQTWVMVWCIGVVIFGAMGIAGLWMQATWTRIGLLFALLGADMLLFVIPSLTGNNLIPLILLAIVMLLVVLFFAPGKITKLIGFVVVLSAVLFMWEGFKLLADTINYSITRPLPGWTYTTQPTLDDTLEAVEAGTIAAAVVDQRDIRDIIAPYPADDEDPIDAETTAYPTLRYLADLDTQAVNPIGMEIRPAFPGRLGVVVTADNVERWQSADDLIGVEVGAVADSFAAADFFPEPREQVLLSLRIGNDLNLPHLQAIAEAFLQPARRNGPVLLARILAGAALYTWQEAIWGFTIGATLGFLLGTIFAHSAILSRSLLPYVVASQTIPIIALAPMVVIWLGAGPVAVAVIAAYLTFFPMTINTLRGLLSPDPMAIELMKSYAATPWQIMWKLRFPAALPYIFTALKVSATASVVGAIIGELPSSIRDGLGRAILDLSSDYSLISTPKLWAAIVSAAAVGIIFFLIVSFIEYLVLHRYIQEA